MSEKKHVIILGAGVIGLTTALKIQEKGGYTVTIIAETLPLDPKSIKYTSFWAGAHHVSHASLKDERQLKIDQETFRVMNKMSAPGGPAEHCFLHIPQIEYYHGEKGKDLDNLSWMPNFRYLERNELVPGTGAGIAFNTFTIDTPVYLPYLLSRFLAGGGKIVRGTVQHISTVIEGGANVYTGAKDTAATPKVDAVVVCTALGTRSLGGVEDKDVYPVRGQTILVRAPWIKFGRTISSADGLWTYIIPRRSGDVIVGGTKIDDDWYPKPRPEITEDILRRGFALCPELAPPEVRAQREPTIDDVRPLIIEEGCGLRPARKGGIRLEVEYFGVQGQTVPVVFNYGHGASGYQSSWGSASIALELLENALPKELKSRY